MKRSLSVTSGSNLRCKGWRQEGLLRMLENVLAVGEDPDNLVVYAAFGRAARDWPSHDKIVATLKTMNDGETLIVQSGKPIGVIKTHATAPVVLMANCNIVGRWATAETFYELEKKNLICWGGLTAGDWLSRPDRSAAERPTGAVCFARFQPPRTQPTQQRHSWRQLRSAISPLLRLASLAS